MHLRWTVLADMVLVGNLHLRWAWLADLDLKRALLQRGRNTLWMNAHMAMWWLGNYSRRGVIKSLAMDKRGMMKPIIVRWWTLELFLDTPLLVLPFYNMRKSVPHVRIVVWHSWSCRRFRSRDVHDWWLPVIIGKRCRSWRSRLSQVLLYLRIKP